MIPDPSAARAAADLAEGEFLAGLDAGRWRVIALAFPTLDFAIVATDAQGKLTEYGFRAELSNFPAQAPMVRIWDHAGNRPLAADKRPKGSQRINTTFQVWTDDTVYRPWDNVTLAISLASGRIRVRAFKFAHTNFFPIIMRARLARIHPRVVSYPDVFWGRVEDQRKKLKERFPAEDSARSRQKAPTAAPRSGR